MTRETLVLVAATAMAALLGGCGGSHQDGSSHQGSSSSQEGSSPQQPEATNTNSVGSCADNGSTDRQQEAGRGEVSNGKIVVQRATDATNDIDVIDEDGTTETHLTHAAESGGGAVLSPDGEKIAFVRRNPDYTSIADIYVMKVADPDQWLQLTDGVADDNDPAWSPDGTEVAFTRVTMHEGYGPSGEYFYEADIYTVYADGSNETRLASGSYPTWSPDGKHIAYLSDTEDLYVVNADGSNETRLASGSYPTWSPDGKHMAYLSDTGDLYVVNADGSNPTLVVDDKNDKVE